MCYKKQPDAKVYSITSFIKSLKLVKDQNRAEKGWKHKETFEKIGNSVLIWLVATEMYTLKKIYQATVFAQDLYILLYLSYISKAEIL